MSINLRDLRKLIAELEEGGQDYVDKEFWDNMVTGGLTGGMRKASQVEDKKEVIEEKTGPELKPEAEAHHRVQEGGKYPGG